jgi:hypothetical protein
MNTIALTRLAALLRKPLPPRTRFNICCWKEQSSCGTAMCAAGLAASNRWFINRGLHMGKPFAGSKVSVPRYRRLSMYNALTAFFDISEENTEYIFGPLSYDWYATREQVAKRIDAVVKGTFS